MFNNEINSKIWKIVFFSGIFLYQVSFIRYLNFYFGGYIPYHHIFIDYEYISLPILIFKCIGFVFCLFLCKSYNDNIYKRSSLIWLLLIFSLSFEVDKYIFIGIFMLFIFSFTNNLILIFKRYINE